MKQPCKHIHREGDSCSLNNNCKYPGCVLDDLIQKVSCNGMREMTTERIKEVCIEHTRLHLEALSEEIDKNSMLDLGETRGLAKDYLAMDELKNEFGITVSSHAIKQTISDYLTKNKLK